MTVEVEGVHFSVAHTHEGVSVMTVDKEGELTHLKYNGGLPEEEFGPFKNGARVFEGSDHQGYQLLQWMKRAGKYLS